MKGFVVNIEKETLANENFRRVLYTSHYSQLVVMSLLPKEDIGEEVHGLDQFIRVEEGNGRVILNDVETKIEAGSAIVIPAGVKHNIINDSAEAKMKLYSVYSPPQHLDKTIHSSKAVAQEEHFDGHVSEDI